MSTATFAFCLSTLLSYHTTHAQLVVPFQTAAATSAISSGAFPAADAVAAGSGYWCSSGNHAHGERVTWTGTASAEPKVAGVIIDWAYGPGEFRIMTSTDGGNFQEAAGWHSASREEISYREMVMFESPRKVKSLSVVMRSPRESGFFGISAISLLAEPGPSMLVSDAVAHLGESCLVSVAGEAKAQSCAAAIAEGSGAEVFSFSQSSQLVSKSTGECLVSIKGALKMQNCEQAVDAEDGRSTFVITPSSQVQTHSGDCVFMTQAGAVAAPCSSGEGNQVSLISVPEVGPGAASQLQDISALLRSATARQRALLEQLKASKQACQGLLQENASHVAIEKIDASEALIQTERTGAFDATSDAILRIDAAVHVDLAAVKRLIAESKAAIAAN